MTDRKIGWGRKLKLASVPIVLASLAACATPFNADVSRFQTQLPAPQGESYFVVADDPALAGGLEFAQYADLVEAQMSRLGYAQAASAENASLLVRFDYGGIPLVPDCRNTTGAFYLAVRRNLVEELDAVFPVHH